MAEDQVVKIEDVSFSYTGEPVLENVNMEIGPREFVSVVGPNGGGKTTLLKLILGLLRPDRGRVRVFGASPRRARPRMGYVPQQSDADLKFPANVMDVALMGRLGRGGMGPFRAADKRAALQALDEVGLADLRGRPFSDLSGGQRQRTLIARALASEPELLLLDEPTASLDSEVEGRIYELLRDMNKRMTLILVSHDLMFVSRFVNSVVCVRREVKMHETGKVSAEALGQMCGIDMRMVQHGETCIGDDCP